MFFFGTNQDKLGRLVNGATALLRLVRASLELDKTGAISATTVSDPGKMDYPSP